MLPTDFEQRNFIFNKPQSMTDEECMSLPVHITIDFYGYPIIISKWKLSKEDLEEVQRTGVVWLSVTGVSTPPVVLFTENPFK